MRMSEKEKYFEHFSLLHYFSTLYESQERKLHLLLSVVRNVEFTNTEILTWLGRRELRGYPRFDV